MSAARPRALPIVLPSEELRGFSPLAFQRAAQACSVGDALHRGLVRVTSALARYAVRAATPPSARATVDAALDGALSWADDAVDEAAVRKLRSTLFTASVEIEQRTVQAVEASLAALPQGRHTAIDHHADGVVLRFAGLGAYYAVSSAVLVLDGVSDPKQLDPVPRQAAGALAYQSAGLGPARSPELRARALEQAGFESGRPGAPTGHGEGALAIQLFHEFLGSHWKDHADAQRAFLSDFIVWALPPERRAS